MTADDVVEECVFLSVFCEMQMKDHPEGRTETFGERNAVWQLGFGRDLFLLFFRLAI